MVVLLFHINAILEAKKVVGMSVVPIAFYSVWGAWNMVYYDSLDQDWSFYAGIGVFVVNTLHVCLMVYYRRYPGGRNSRPGKDKS